MEFMNWAVRNPGLFFFLCLAFGSLTASLIASIARWITDLITLEKPRGWR